MSIDARSRRFQRTDDGVGLFGLFARKATDAVFVEALRCNPRLNIDLVAKAGARTNIASRAAAISATHLVVIHPLWRADASLLERLGAHSPGVHTITVDTFDLERRPLRALEMADAKDPAPPAV